MYYQKQIKDYLDKSIRNIRHRNGFGVHSPFAYNIIREVIEEKCAYYAYLTMKSYYSKTTPISFKQACLLFRLANRFCVRTVLETSFDGGYTDLPLLIFDSRSQVTAVTPTHSVSIMKARQPILRTCFSRISNVTSLKSIADSYVADMVVVGEVPKDFDSQSFAAWLKNHTHERSLIYFKGVRQKPISELWKLFCDDEEIEISMDMFDNGLVIRRPRFFKQHYIVAF